MSDVIDFMERMGGDAQLSQASTGDLAAILDATDIAPELKSAVLARDAQGLEALLGTKPACVLVAPPGPPGTGPKPMQPGTPPLPTPEEEGEEQESTDRLAQSGVSGGAARERESLRS